MHTSVKRLYQKCQMCLDHFIVLDTNNLQWPNTVLYIATHLQNPLILNLKSNLIGQFSPQVPLSEV